MSHRTVSDKVAGEGHWVNVNRNRWGYIPVKSPAELMRWLGPCSIIHFWVRPPLPVCLFPSEKDLRLH